MAKIRIVLVDDHVVLRSALRLLIDSQPDTQVVGQASQTQEGFDVAKRTRPDIAVIDLSIPGEGGLKLIERLRHELPATRIVVLTTHDDPVYVRAALAAGALAYVAKTAADSELLAAIRAAQHNRVFVSVALRDKTPVDLLHATPGQGTTAENDGLSPREMEVLRFLALGHTNSEISEQLSLSVKTIETYRARIGIKIGAKNRADIVRYAMGKGVLQDKQ